MSTSHSASRKTQSPRRAHPASRSPRSSSRGRPVGVVGAFQRVPCGNQSAAKSPFVPDDRIGRAAQTRCRQTSWTCPQALGKDIAPGSDRPRSSPARGRCGRAGHAIPPRFVPDLPREDEHEQIEPLASRRLVPAGDDRLDQQHTCAGARRCADGREHATACLSSRPCRIAARRRRRRRRARASKKLPATTSTRSPSAASLRRPPPEGRTGRRAVRDGGGAARTSIPPVPPPTSTTVSSSQLEPGDAVDAL